MRGLQGIGGWLKALWAALAEVWFAAPEYVYIGAIFRRGDRVFFLLPEVLDPGNTTLYRGVIDSVDLDLDRQLLTVLTVPGPAVGTARYGIRLEAPIMLREMCIERTYVEEGDVFMRDNPPEAEVTRLRRRLEQRQATDAAAAEYNDRIARATYDLEVERQRALEDFETAQNRLVARRREEAEYDAKYNEWRDVSFAVVPKDAAHDPHTGIFHDPGSVPHQPLVLSPGSHEWAEALDQLAQEMDAETAASQPVTEPEAKPETDGSDGRGGGGTGLPETLFGLPVVESPVLADEVRRAFVEGGQFPVKMGTLADLTDPDFKTITKADIDALEAELNKVRHPRHLRIDPYFRPIHPAREPWIGEAGGDTPIITASGGIVETRQYNIEHFPAASPDDSTLSAAPDSQAKIVEYQRIFKLYLEQGTAGLTDAEQGILRAGGDGVLLVGKIPSPDPVTGSATESEATPLELLPGELEALVDEFVADAIQKLNNGDTEGDDGREA